MYVRARRNRRGLSVSLTRSLGLAGLLYGLGCTTLAHAAAHQPPRSIGTGQTGTDSGRIRTEIAFASASRIAAEARANDQVVRSLRQRITSLEAQVRRGATRADVELTAAKQEMLERLAATDTAFAQQQAAFVQAVSGLFALPDSRVDAALARYAQGDATALDELALLFRNADRTSAERIVNQRAYAALLTDAYQKGTQSRAEAITALEREVANYPDNSSAWTELAYLYGQTGQVDRARHASAQIAAHHRDAQTQIIAFDFQGNASRAAGDLAMAERQYTAAVVLGREFVRNARNEPPPIRGRNGQLVYATESEVQRVNFSRTYLGGSLHNLTLVQLERGHLEDARRTAQESIAVREAAVADAAAAGDTPEALDHSWIWVEMVRSIQGKIEIAAGEGPAAVAFYEQALKAAEHRTGGPFVTRIEFARALIAAGDLDRADQALATARLELAREEPSPFAFASEARYWQQMGYLYAAQDRTADSQRAFSSAAALFTQALSLDPHNADWMKGLSEVSTGQ